MPGPGRSNPLQQQGEWIVSMTDSNIVDLSIIGRTESVCDSVPSGGIPGRAENAGHLYYASEVSHIGSFGVDQVNQRVGLLGLRAWRERGGE